MTKIFNLFLIKALLTICLSMKLLGQDIAHDMSLRSFVAPKPKILGIDPEFTPKEAEETLKQMGLEFSKKEEVTPLISLYAYQGMPKGLWVRDGQTNLYFFQNKLMRINLLLKPTYTNFLLSKKQLFNSLGERFTIKKSKESIDEFLKVHLANLKDGEYDARTEKEIQSALRRGNTFYFYSLADNKNDLNVVLSYSYPKNNGSDKEAQLLLHYGFVEVQEELELYEEAMKAKILPE